MSAPAMRRRDCLRPARTPFVVAAGLALAGCGGSDETCGEPLYAGAASDEAWRTMVDAEDDVSSGDPLAAVIEVPAEGQTFDAAAPPPRLSWTSSLAAGPRRHRPIRATRAGVAPSPWPRVARFLIASAQAHLPPITGDIHALDIRVPGRNCPIAVLTTDLFWQVDESSWAAMRDAGGTLSMTLTSAYLTENRVSEGPYRTSARTFSIAP
jgi:hypothetical protein